MGEISLGNLYDMNKIAMKNEKALKPFEIKDKIREIVQYFDKYSFKYYMLLCREQYDFTLFNDTINKNWLTDSTFKQDLYECLTNRGEVLSIDPADGNAFEIWLRILNGEDDNIFVYYLFPYDNGVIEIKEK